LHFFHEFIVSSPPSLSIAANTDAIAAEIDYAPDEQPTDDQTLSAELPGKQSPLTHADTSYSFSLLLALEIAVALLYPTLMHSLFLSPVFDTLPVIP
jgi:hypothetical protein